MKTHRLLALAIGLTLPSLSFAQVLVQTSTNQWELDSTNTLVGTQTSQTISASNTNDIDVDQYLGALDLTRVVIRILQPKTSVSPLIDSNISISGESGTVEFTSASISETTTFTAANASIFAPLIVNGGPILANNISSVSDSDGNFTLNNTDVKNQQVDITSSDVWFDSDSMGSMTSTQLNAVFRTASNLSFKFDTASTFAFSRTGTTQIQADISGINSGRIVVDYYAAVPEPSTALLLGASGLLFLLRRRRQVVS